ncbi:zinc-binding dehydrogenase [Nonomuraea sp. ZG12]|uniref:zinc-binding dehydrogenase n=1 Tax=Nonomuraea sp. ZG12 TaxID=3452207 RepID=UPI003F88D148
MVVITASSTRRARRPAARSLPHGTTTRWRRGELGELIDAGALEVRIDSTYGFDRTAEAFARVETRRAKGKVVVEVGAPAG